MFSVFFDDMVSPKVLGVFIFQIYHCLMNFYSIFLYVFEKGLNKVGEGVKISNFENATLRQGREL